MTEQPHHHHRHGHGPADLPTDHCADMLKQVYACLDGQLTPERKAEIEAHVAKCPCCLKAYDFEAKLLSAIRAPCTEDAKVKELRAQILTALEKQGFCRSEKQV
jgi:anti-sigma factor (TIGR02949 family)